MYKNVKRISKDQDSGPSKITKHLSAKKTDASPVELGRLVQVVHTVLFRDESF